MNASPFDIPNNMRDFAESSVEQAREAFEGFLAVAQGAAGIPAEVAGQGGPQSLAAHVFSCTEQNVNAAFDLARKLVRAKDPQEAFTLQSEYLKSRIAALQAQAQEIGAVFQNSMTASWRQAA